MTRTLTAIVNGHKPTGLSGNPVEFALDTK
jgi:hypothetical protein